MSNAKSSKQHRAIIAAIAVAAFAAVGALASPGIAESPAPTALAAAAPAAAPTAPGAAATPQLSGPTLRLISQSEYTNTIKQIFGDDIAVHVRLAPVTRVDGLLAVGASTAVLTSGGFEPLEGSSRAIATQVIAPERRTLLIPCRPANETAADDACARTFLAKVGRLLYRRPLRQQEVDRLVQVAAQGVHASGNFYDGIAFALSGMLVSPDFLFIRETTERDPRSPSGVRLDGYSMASRLSFLLWDAGPDDELLQAAERGDLRNPDRVRRQVDRMIASPRYENGVRAFFTDFFVLEAFDTLAKDSTIYPGMTLKAIGESREQLLRTVVDHLVARHGDYRDLYTTRRTFMSSDLGVLYRLPISLGSQGWAPYEFAANDPRAGILTQIGFLAQYAHPGRSSATRRGRAIREVLLCQKVPDPPGNVDFSQFENPRTSALTARERLDMHRTNPVCAGCHARTDPIGLALENFDGAGQFRTTERGASIDASGALDGVQFTNAVGLGAAVRDNPALRTCIVNRLYAYSKGRRLSHDEVQAVQLYRSELDTRGYRFDTMLRLIILDPSFFAVQPPAGDTQTASRREANAHQE